MALLLLVTPATSYLDSEGNLLVADYGANALLKFDPNGALIGGIGVDESGLRVDGWDSGVRSWMASALPGGFDRLHMVATDKAGNIYALQIHGTTGFKNSIRMANYWGG